MKELNEKLQKAIEESLPKQLGDALQKRLNELEDIEDKFKNLSDLYNNQSKDLMKTKKERDDTIKELAIKNDLLKNIRKREREIVEREIKLEVNELKYKLEEADKRATELHGLVQTVFKSPVYRKSYNLIGGSQVAGNDQYGNPLYNTVGDKNGDVIQTEE